MVTAKVLKSAGSVVDEDQRSGQLSRILNHDALEALDARIEAFTGYSTKTAESYQIVNYGLGGHYLPHFDAFGKHVRYTFFSFIVCPRTLYTLR